MRKLYFTGEFVTGDLDLDMVKMVCVPQKEKYNEVDICLKDDWNLSIATITTRSLAYEEKKKLGYEIEKRWNFYLENKDKIEKLKDELSISNRIFEKAISDYKCSYCEEKRCECEKCIEENREYYKRKGE